MNEMDNFRIIGENKNGEDIKETGFSFPMSLLFYDTYPHWYNHTITFTVTAYYGQPSLLGWTDMHELKTQVVLKIVPGGE